MILPEGSIIGKFSGSLEDIIPFTVPFLGVIHIVGTKMEGLILIDKGKFIASYLKNDSGELKSNQAYEQLEIEKFLEFELRKYSAEEFALARNTSAIEGLLIALDENGKPLKQKKLSKGWNLEKIQNQPGVLSVAAFLDGFAIESAGKADFEQIAAVAEDLLGISKKIASDLNIEPLNQIILETPHGKFIIAPYGDINVCIFTESDANLGMIRMALRNLQSEKD